jgi:N-acetylglucosamine repressor
MLKATRQQTKRHNLRLVMRTIYNDGGISRADIARVTGLTRPTVSRIVAKLIDERYVVETGQGPSAGGKRPTLLDVNLSSHHLLAIDLGSSEFRGAVVNLQGEILQRLTIPTGGQRGDEALDLVRDLLRNLASMANAPILGIGIGTPGLTNPDDGVIREAVNLGWSKLPLADLLSKEFQQPIYVANDSHMAALGEYTFGANREDRDLIVIKIGQGIGSGIILDGQPYYGDGYGAGEIGHVVVEDNGRKCSCGNYGCLETTTSTRAIIQAAHTQAESSPDSLLGPASSLTWENIVSALKAGDPAACNVVQEAGKFLGVAIANLVATLNIHRIVIAGRVHQLGETFLNSALNEARHRTLPSMVADTKVSYSDLGSDIVILGSSAMVLKQELGVI